MNDWQSDQEADNVTFIPDGNGMTRLQIPPLCPFSVLQSIHDIAFCKYYLHLTWKHRRVYGEDGHAGGQVRHRVRQALVALFDAGQERRG